MGRRASKTVNGVRTYYISLGDQEIAEYDNSGAPFRCYVYSTGLDEPLVLVGIANQHSYHLTDALDSVIGLLDNSSSLTERHAYTAYGISLGSSATLYQYAGRRLDEETGLYHNRARAYSPSLGRFLQADPIGMEGGLNVYAYVGNDPLNAADPMGLQASNPLKSGAGNAPDPGVYQQRGQRANSMMNSYDPYGMAAAAGALYNLTQLFEFRRGGELDA